MLALPALAGCAAAPPGPDTAKAPPGGCHAVAPPELTSFADGPDWSKETLSIGVASSGSFAFLLAPPTSEEGTSLHEWLANATLPPGWSATASGSRIRVDGQGAGVVAMCSIQQAGRGDVAEAYLGATWGEAGTRPDELPVEVEAGAPSLDVGYRAASHYCGATADFDGAARGPGHIVLGGRSVAECT